MWKNADHLNITAAQRRRLLFATAVVVVAYAVCNEPLACLCIAKPQKLSAPVRPTLVVITHDYEHVDLFCMRSITQSWFKETGIGSTFVVANLSHNKLFCNLMQERNGETERCIYVKGGTTSAVQSALQHSHVCLFLYRSATGTGVYHMAQDSSVLLVRIVGPEPNCSHEHCSVAKTVALTYGQKYRVESEAFRKPRSKESAESYMKAIKKRLYP